MFGLATLSYNRGDGVSGILRRRVAGLIIAWTIGLAICGCANDSVSLRVDLRTDLQPGTEFEYARIEIVGTGQLRTVPVSSAEVDWASDAPSVEFSNLEPGTLEVHAGLFRPSMKVVETRLLVQVEQSTGVTAILSRSCVGVTCDAEQNEVCLAGQCTSATCQSSDSCTPECSRDSDCPRFVRMCSTFLRPRCVS